MDGNIEKMQSLTGRIKGLGIDKTLTKKGMCAEAEATGKALATKVSITDIVDDLLSVATDKPLSANQGRLLKKLIDEIDPHYAENVLYNDTNVKDALDKVSNVSDNVADVQTKVNRLYDIEKLRIAKNFTSSTDFTTRWTYTATKKCLVNGTIRFTQNNGYPTQIALYRNTQYEALAICTSDNTLYDKTLPFSLLLEKDEQINAKAKYNNASNNAYVVEGYVQYLE
jgi:hypothetical protein